MKLTLSAALCALALLFSATPTAHAGFITEAQLLGESRTIAHQFWNARNVWPRWEPITSQMQCGGNPDGCFNIYLRRVEINPLLVIRAMYDLDVNGGSSGWPAQAYVCAVAAHEYGHSAGLQHTASGLMRGSGLRYVYSDWPYECKVYAASR
jgi:hypothetical protein